MYLVLQICRMGKRMGITASLPSDFTLGLGQFKVSYFSVKQHYFRASVP
jgi:hypothetical protein